MTQHLSMSPSLSTLVFLFLAIVLVSSATAGKKSECSYCKYDSDCSTHFCFKNKCLYRNRKSLTKCFTDLCGYCKHDYECISERCYNYKCVPKLKPHFKKCFPHKPKPSASSTPTATPTLSSTSTATATPTPSTTPSTTHKKENCEPCNSGLECTAGFCTQFRIVPGRNTFFCGTVYSMQFCPFATSTSSPTSSITPSQSPSFKKENCEPCKYGYECAIGYCANYYCGTPYTLRYCPIASPSPSTTPSVSSTPSPSPKKADREPCKYGYECAAGYCLYYQCGKPYAVHNFKKVECDTCEKDHECETGKCRYSICIKNYHSVYKCKQ